MEELEALVALERDCCAFADWTLEMDGDQVVLEVSGDSEEAIAAVQGMFSSFEPAPATRGSVAERFAERCGSRGNGRMTSKGG